MTRLPTYIVHPSRPLQLEPTDKHGGMAEIRVLLDEPRWTVKDFLRCGANGWALRHVTLKRYLIRSGGPERFVYAVDAESALKACEADE